MDKINKNTARLRVMLVPLDWGLGHATRCIPIIKVLQQQGVDVITAGEGVTVKILEKAQENPVILPLKGYRVHYSKNPSFLFPKLLFQSAKIAAIIRHENDWVKQVAKAYHIDGIISDNRFGIYHKNIPSIFITHQLFINTGISLLDKVAQKINYRCINKFSQCWIPDQVSSKNLTRKLSHPQHLPAIPVKYLGVVSRFNRSSPAKKNGILLLLSGPEPQRTIFEELLMLQIQTVKVPVTLVRGLPAGSKKNIPNSDNLTVYDHLPDAELNLVIESAEWVIARSGYSTVMDLVKLSQRAILVPTPGQAEQEYLASHLLDQKLFYTCSQKDFQLEKALTEAQQNNFSCAIPLAGLNEEVIRDWIGTLRK